MPNIRRSTAIKLFLEANTWPDLAALYSHELEVQVNVAQDGGECIDRFFQGRNWREYTDGVQTWGPFRMPRNSMDIPEDNDFDLRFDLPLHVEGIGSTGWNWKQRRSKWVAFDFDAIVGHAETHSRKLNQTEINEIKDKMMDIQWVTIRKSTGGAGLHLYVFIDQSFNDAINNHSEHMAVGRSILSQLSVMAGFDLEAKVDVYAGNMWLWHRKMLLPDGTRNPNSLLLIKQGSPLKEIPAEWRDYVDVTAGKKRRTVPFFVKGVGEGTGTYDEFEELSNQRPKIPLDEDHKRLLDWIQTQTPGGSWWRDDHHMLVTHTFILKQAHAALKLKGCYDTLAEGSAYGADWNTYLFPMPNGAWRARRFTKGCTEHKFWSQDGHGWTVIWFNKLPDFKTACLLNNGVEKPNGGFVFNEAHFAIDAAKMLGSELKVADRMLGRTAVLKQHRDKRLIIEMEKEAKDTADGMDGFDGTGKAWTKIFDARIEQTIPSTETMHLDKIVRHVVNEGGADEGWVVKSGDIWQDEPLEHVKLILKGHFGYKPADVDQILGTGVVQPYRIVNRPFDVEYPPGRLWNRRGAKFRFQPSQSIDNLRFPTWLKVLEHLGTSLTSIIQQHPWSQANAIRTGADYLMLWIAAKFQRPYDRLPYLFFYSDEQNTGKSTFHEAIALLLEGDPPRGYMKVTEALKAAAQFNAELQHAILCVVEELDLNPRKNDAKISYNRIKELVTANHISIHEKRQTPVMVKNTTSWIQCFVGSDYTLTNKGPRRIDDLVGKSTVLIINQHSILTEGFFRTGNKEVLELETVEGFKIRTTADHELLADCGTRTNSRTTAREKMRNYSWRQLQHFSPGENIVIHDHHNVQWSGPGTFEEGYLLGWVFGDGTINYQNHVQAPFTGVYPRIDVFEPDFILLPKLFSFFTEGFSYSTSETGTNRYQISSPELNRLADEFGIGPKKVITSEMKATSSNFYKGFISAMFDTDGTIESQTIRITLGQSDELMLHEIQRMLIFLGIYSKVRQVTKADDNANVVGRPCKAKAKYCLRITQGNAERFEGIIGFQHPTKRIALRQSIEDSISNIKREHRWIATVKSIKSIGTHPVFDVRVPDLNRLSVNGIMAHNCANDKSSCPIFQNDSRITMIRVLPIDEVEIIPKKRILDLLIKEAPDFLAHIIRLEIPESNDRLTIPVIETEDKARVQQSNLSTVEQFIKEECVVADGELILWGEFFDRFMHWMEPSEIEKWTKRYTGARMPERHPKARSKDNNQYCVSNIAWRSTVLDASIKPRLIVRGDYLVPLIEENANGQQS